MKHLIPLAALLLVAACDMAMPEPDVDGMPTSDALCGADDQSLVGRPEAVLAAMTFPLSTRIFRTGDALTMDYRPDRLNIEIGVDDTIVVVSCG